MLPENEEVVSEVVAANVGLYAAPSGATVATLETASPVPPGFVAITLHRKSVP